MVSRLEEQGPRRRIRTALPGGSAHAGQTCSDVVIRERCTCGFLFPFLFVCFLACLAVACHVVYLHLSGAIRHTNATHPPRPATQPYSYPYVQSRGTTNTLCMYVRLHLPYDRDQSLSCCAPWPDKIRAYRAAPVTHMARAARRTTLYSVEHLPSMYGVQDAVVLCRGFWLSLSAKLQICAFGSKCRATTQRSRQQFAMARVAPYVYTLRHVSQEVPSQARKKT